MRERSWARGHGPLVREPQSDAEYIEWLEEDIAFGVLHVEDLEARVAELDTELAQVKRTSEERKLYWTGGGGIWHGGYDGDPSHSAEALFRDAIEHLQSAKNWARLWKRAAKKLEAERDAAQRKLDKLAKALSGRLSHDRASYDGDGDPGCYRDCLACAVQAARE